MRQVATIVVATMVLAAPQAAAKTGVPSRLLGFVGGGRSASFVKLDPLTLAPISKALPVGTSNPSFVATVAGGGRAAVSVNAALRFLDFPRMRWEFRIAYPGTPAAALWNYADKLVTLNQSSTAEVIVVDPTKRRYGAIRPLGGALVASVVSRDRIVAVLAPLEGVGPAKLAVIDDTGRVRTTALPQIRAGGETVTTDPFTIRFEYPALAVDGTRAVVISGTGTIVDVRLDTLVPTVYASRFPASAHKLANGSTRIARFVDPHVIALTGLDASYDGTTQRSSPAGLTLIDTRDWSVRRLDADTVGLAPNGFGPGCIVCTNVLVAYGSNGLAGYDVDGTLKFRLFQGTDVRPATVAGSYAYIGAGTHFTIVDTWTGSIVKTVDTAIPTFLATP